MSSASTEGDRCRGRSSLALARTCEHAATGTDEANLVFPTHPISRSFLHQLTLLITDIGVLTPSAVSDELIKLYY